MPIKLVCFRACELESVIYDFLVSWISIILFIANDAIIKFNVYFSANLTHIIN